MVKEGPARSSESAVERDREESAVLVGKKSVDESESLVCSAQRRS